MEITSDLILNTLKDWIEQKKVIPATQWIDACQKLNILTLDEQEKLVELEQKVGQLKLLLLDSQEKHNVSEVRLRIEATDEYKAMKFQRAKIDRIEEAIRIAKLQARLREWGQ